MASRRFCGRLFRRWARYRSAIESLGVFLDVAPQGIRQTRRDFFPESPHARQGAVGLLPGLLTVPRSADRGLRQRDETGEGARHGRLLAALDAMGLFLHGDRRAGF